jgi:hypothetical protein
MSGRIALSLKLGYLTGGGSCIAFFKNGYTAIFNNCYLNLTFKNEGEGGHTHIKFSIPL